MQHLTDQWRKRRGPESCDAIGTLRTMDQRLGAGLLERMLQHAPARRGVQQRRHDADLGETEPYHRKLGAIVHHERDYTAGREARRKRCVRDPVRELVHLSEAELAALENDERTCSGIRGTLLEHVRHAIRLIAAVGEDARVAAAQALLRHFPCNDFAITHSSDSGHPAFKGTSERSTVSVP